MLLVSNVLSLPFRTFKPKNFSHERVSNPMELCKEHRYLDGSGMLTIKALVMTANCYSSTRVDLLTFTAATDRCSIALAAGFGGGGGYNKSSYPLRWHSHSCHAMSLRIS